MACNYKYLMSDGALPDAAPDVGLHGAGAPSRSFPAVARPTSHEAKHGRQPQASPCMLTIP
jgi:hypothetical protein